MFSFYKKHQIVVHSVCAFALVLAFLGFTIFASSSAQEAFKYPTLLPPYGNPTIELSSSDCSGPLFAGKSSRVFDVGSVKGYIKADEACGSAVSGSHVCGTDEMMRTIRCKKDKIKDYPTEALWINNGPPGYTANTNDCKGWQTNSSSYYGAYWKFDKDYGGIGYTGACSKTDRSFSCCK